MSDDLSAEDLVHIEAGIADIVAHPGPSGITTPAMDAALSAIAHEMEGPPNWMRRWADAVRSWW